MRAVAPLVSAITLYACIVEESESIAGARGRVELCQGREHAIRLILAEGDFAGHEETVQRGSEHVSKWHIRPRVGGGEVVAQGLGKQQGQRVGGGAVLGQLPAQAFERERGADHVQ
jgi:hypothetical protein